MADLKLESAKLDSADLEEEGGYIQIKKAHDGGAYSGYFIQWNFAEEIDQ